MDNSKFQLICNNKVIEYLKEKDIEITLNDIYTVWLSKVLQNNKCLISTNISDGLYYEFTFNGDKKELYMDVYSKKENRVIKVEV